MHSSCSLIRPASRLKALSRVSVRRRLYSTEAQDQGPVRIQVGSSGSVSIDLFQPFSSVKPISFIFYLPRGPIPFSSSSIPPEPTDLRPLAEAAQAVVARVNYRLTGDGHETYPLPIHDVGSAYQWLFGLRMSQMPGVIGPRYLPPIGVCGEFIGGSLAAMLALTECHARPLPGITAAYLGNPIADWTTMHGANEESGSTDVDGAKHSIFSTEQTKSQKPTSWQQYADAPELSSTKLLTLRHKLFANSSYWFDNFASPLLFFRTPSEPEPKSTKEEDEAFEAVMQTTTEDSDQATMDGLGGLLPTEPTKSKKFRVSQRRWPPTRSGLILPHMHTTLGLESPLRDMGVDLTKAMNRSVFLHELDKAGELSEVDRATMEDRSGAGAWGGDELVTMGNWFKEVFRYN